MTKYNFCCHKIYIFFHGHGGESDIMSHIERVLYLFQQMTSKSRSLGACEQFYSILKCWFDVIRH